MTKVLRQTAWVLLPIVAALLVITLMLILLQAFTDLEAGPAEVLEAFWKSLSSQSTLSTRKIANVVEFWIPLVLVSMGLVVTFRAGLWNIGIEGQMVMGGLFASGVAFAQPSDNPLILIPLCLIAAMVGGAFWALVAGILKTSFGVNEIFGGVALNALANQITLQLIAGAWKPGASDKAQYSRDIPEAAMLPPIARDFDVSLLALLIAIAAVVLVVLALNGTRWGLNLKATGRNGRSALLLGVPVTASALGAMAICGALAGIGGAHRIIFTEGLVTGQFSGGIGFIGLLVVLLVGMRGGWVPLVALLFTIILNAGTQLQFIQLDSSLTGVLQGVLVLVVMLSTGIRDRLQQNMRKPKETQPAASTAASPLIEGAD
ncbi:ABC transporter permease [Phototrophicus methaneseepsis]|uniref:ABC transporter permease n=1 Tax=Phototrophicus methaneseepsis TaxID=2710758 RepID=A0A7S8IGA5_9CHLR|nr:ABC transporter permease [Phototrophicus methaneseepsis]QPC83803.1 ABC transporter permease [Phototrophicus methaneseepsis]